MTARRPARLLLRALAATAAAITTVVVAAPPAQAADRIRDAQWHLDFLKISQAHAISQGAGVTVAVIDTGVDANHPDLAGAVMAGQDFAILKQKPPDGRTDLDGHGTAMAGLIAGRGHGGNGALGIAPKATILPVRDSEGGEGNRASDVHTAIRWAAQQGAGVISMSFGMENDDRDVAAAIEAARRADVVLVAAVGNSPGDKTVGYPARYPGVIAVGGVDRRGDHAAVSVTGPEVDIVAPAVDIMSTEKGGKYRTRTGTSDATAIVAGAAALVRSKYPDLSAAEVAYRLTATATDKGAKGRDNQYGAGVLDIVAALTADLPPMPADASEPLAEPTWQRPGPPPVASQPEDSGLPVGLIAGAAGVLLVGGVLIGVISFMLVRNRRRMY